MCFIGWTQLPKGFIGEGLLNILRHSDVQRLVNACGASTTCYDDGTIKGDTVTIKAAAIKGIGISVKFLVSND